MDPPADPGYEPMPERLAPMLARLGKLPRDEERYGFEVKWDGVRALAYSDHGHWALQGRNFTDFTPRYPELRELSRELGSHRVVLDGEVVALDEQGRPSFERMQQRMHLASDSAVRRRMRDLPVTYVIFDLLYLDGHYTLPLPYEERRSLLERLELEGAVVAHAGLPPRRGQRAARRHQADGRGGRGGQAARRPVRAGTALVGLDQGQERAHAGRGHRRLDAGRGRPQRRASARSPQG